MARPAKATELKPGVELVSITAENCELCDASIGDAPNWWPDQDGIYIECPTCGHINAFIHPAFIDTPADNQQAPPCE